jgi:hypothetical protein
MNVSQRIPLRQDQVRDLADFDSAPLVELPHELCRFRVAACSAAMGGAKQCKFLVQTEPREHKRIHIVGAARIPTPARYIIPVIFMLPSYRT